MTDKTQVSARSGLNRNFRDNADGSFAEEFSNQLRAWDPVSLTWVKVIVDHASGSLSTTGGGGGGGGAITVADGADVAQGTTTDLSSASTVVGILKAIKAAVQATLTVSGSLGRTWTLGSGNDSATVVQGAAGATAWKVDGSAVTQPVSLATNSPDVVDRSGRLLGHVTVDSAPSTAVTGPLTDTQLRASRVPVDGSGVTQPVSATALPLPTGAATDATVSSSFGSPTSDIPGAYTVLDQLVRIRKLIDQERQLVQQLVTLQTPAPKPRVNPTLLHRS